MLRLLKHDYRYLCMALFAGATGFAVALGRANFLFSLPTSSRELSIALASVTGTLWAAQLLGSFLVFHIKGTLSEQNRRLHGALEHMTQGLCMFDAQNRLLVWNERYRAMYNIDPKRMRTGCPGRELIEARIAAGTFPLDPDRYRKELLAALARREVFTLTVDMPDGRVIAVVNSPMESGGWVTTHEDITERKKAERVLEQTRKFLDTVIENVPSPIVVKDIPELRYLLINRAAERFFGIRRDAMLNNTSATILPKASAEAIEAADRRAIAAGKPVFRDEHSVDTPGNGTRFVTATRIPVAGSEAQPRYLINVINDVTERRLNAQRLAHMAQHDPLTNLPNRLAFNERMEMAIGRANKAGKRFAVICVDIDHFKAVNDVFGHVIGDKVLDEVARRLTAVGHGHFLARIGGDQLAIITSPGEQPAGAEGIADRIMSVLASDIVVEEHSIRIGVSLGIGIFPQDGADASTLVSNVDAALSRAKSEARGSIRFFEPSMDQELRIKRMLQQDLRSALARDEITLHYQPLAYVDGRITGFEALVRWQHPRHGMVPPSTFIPIAEENGDIVEIGEWILRSACREAALWPRDLRVCVNLSPVQFEHGDLPLFVHQILLETGLEPSRLELEITEGVLIRDFSRALSILRRLKNLGVRIAMDDFGTGYSSLSYLQAFPFDRIKIDRAFVANIGQTQQAGTIIRAVIALGHGLDLPVVAEGVETEEQLSFLAGENCKEVQGYLIGRPKPITDYADAIGRPPTHDRPARQVLAS
jgi:diguanylate cyclase (GGDEF)-like protein/PAS domain S-box-containing protein